MAVTLGNEGDIHSGCTILRKIRFGFWVRNKPEDSTTYSCQSRRDEPRGRCIEEMGFIFVECEISSPSIQ
jgi:hypothetical protein